MSDVNLMVTLCPSFPHFEEFAQDTRLSGIRINSAMLNLKDIEFELNKLSAISCRVPLYFDVKGRQLRIQQVDPFPGSHFELVMNHPVILPGVDLGKEVVTVLLKGGEDQARLIGITDGGYRLILDKQSIYGPQFNLAPGESICIRNSKVFSPGPQFTNHELSKISLVRRAGIDRFFLSYVHCQADVDEFHNLVGSEAEIFLKVEDKRGLEYVRNEYKPHPRRRLVAALGDLYVEVDRPHEVLQAADFIVSKDPRALVGSRMLLSLVTQSVPSAADLMQLGFLYELGYDSFMLCDELCLKRDMLNMAVNVFDSFKQSYPKVKV